MITLSEAEMEDSVSVDVNVEVVIDRLVLDKKNPDMERILDSIETAMKLGGGSMIVVIDNKDERKQRSDKNTL